MGIDFSEVETRLRDGTAVFIRRMRPGDVEYLRAAFAKLSYLSRERRFMSGLSELSEDQLRYLTDVDFVDHFAWIAFLADDRNSAIGVGRWIRVQADPEVAEAAITVLDEYQNRGLGTILLALLAASAQEAGIDRFRAYVGESNWPVRDLLESLGVSGRFDSPGLLCADIPVALDSLADSPARRALNALMTDAVHPGRRRSRPDTPRSA